MALSAADRRKWSMTMEHRFILKSTKMRICDSITAEWRTERHAGNADMPHLTECLILQYAMLTKSTNYIRR